MYHIFKKDTIDYSKGSVRENENTHMNQILALAWCLEIGGLKGSQSSAQHLHEAKDN